MIRKNNHTPLVNSNILRRDFCVYQNLAVIKCDRAKSPKLIQIASFRKILQSNRYLIVFRISIIYRITGSFRTRFDVVVAVLFKTTSTAHGSGLYICVIIDSENFWYLP